MGCQHPPSLGDAQIGSIRLATAEDLTRLQQAQDELKRQIFGGAIIHDRKLGEIHFNQNEFDQADRYEREHGLPTISSVGRPRSGPRLLISFYTDVVLVDSGDENTIYTTDANLILCDHPQMMVGRSTLMWNGRFLSSALLPKIKRSAVSNHKPQEYEVMIPISPAARAVTLMRPPGDLCLALIKYNWPFHDTHGAPLRIDWRTVKTVLLPLADHGSIPHGIGN
jgi:hypothetical protein